jgi:hypothetical protein
MLGSNFTNSGLQELDIDKFHQVIMDEPAFFLFLYDSASGYSEAATVRLALFQVKWPMLMLIHRFVCLAVGARTQGCVQACRKRTDLLFHSSFTS